MRTNGDKRCQSGQRLNGAPDSGLVIVSILLGYWGTLAYEAVGLDATIGVSITPLRQIVGVALLTIAPGTLACALLGLNERSLGVFIGYVVGLSLSILSILTVVVSTIYPVLGIERPLSLYPLSVTLTALLLVAAIAVILTDRQIAFPALPSIADGRAGRLFLLLATVPAFTVPATYLINRYGITFHMYGYLLGIALLVVVTVRMVSEELYPVAIYMLALSVLLHRNLLTNFVVGSDIQETYFVAELILRIGRWDASLGSGSTLAALPTVAAVPAIYTVLADVALAFVYKLIYSFVFALVPIGMFYAFKELFNDEEALLGCFFFVFYFGTFNEVPGKQRIAELFVILTVLVLIRQDWSDHRTKAVVVLFGLGLIFSHYTVSYVFGLSTGVASVIVLCYGRVTGHDQYSINGSAYICGFLVVATVWYVFASGRLLGTLAEVPPLVLAQAQSVLAGETLHRTGAQEVQTQTSFIGTLNLSLHAALVVLIAVGLSCLVYHTVRGERSPGRTAYAALSVPLLGFLGVSFFLSGNLGVDRMYQIVLVFLAPLMPVGYRVLRTAALRTRRADQPGWTSLSVVLAVLILLNTGVLYNVAEAPISSDIALDSDTHSLAYSDAELAGGLWLNEHTAGDTTIYTDIYTSEMFRSIAPSGYTDTNVTLIKTDWTPYVRFSADYVYVRNNSVVKSVNDRSTEFQYVTKPEKEFINNRSNNIYTNEDATIFRYAGSQPVVYDRDAASANETARPKRVGSGSYP